MIYISKYIHTVLYFSTLSWSNPNLFKWCGLLWSVPHCFLMLIASHLLSSVTQQFSCSEACGLIYISCCFMRSHLWKLVKHGVSAHLLAITYQPMRALCNLEEFARGHQVKVMRGACVSESDNGNFYNQSPVIPMSLVIPILEMREKNLTNERF